MNWTVWPISLITDFLCAINVRLLVFRGSLTSTLIRWYVVCVNEVTKDIPAALIAPVLNSPTCTRICTDQTLDYN